MEQTINNIVKWLQQHVQSAGGKGLLVGVSGGLDSAVVLHLIKRAFPTDSLAVIMPLRSNPVDMKHAEQVVQSCAADALTIDLTKTHETMQREINDQLGDAYHQGAGKMADANLRARLRMSTLYTIATHYNYLVVGTDNASEYYTGYFTKHGDGGVDLLPIVDFTKGEVQQMAKVLGVPEEVIDKQPSADLWEGQTDEQEMGTTYEKIDAYLKGESIPEADRKRIEQMHNRTQHKRDPIPMYTRS
ncbi:MAG TPA: NAD(+) synthase [Bacillota bacterium]